MVKIPLDYAAPGGFLRDAVVRFLRLPSAYVDARGAVAKFHEVDTAGRRRALAPWRFLNANGAVGIDLANDGVHDPPKLWLPAAPMI